MTDISVLDLEKRLKEEISKLTSQRNRIEGELAEIREKAKRIISDAEKEARKIVEGAKSEAQLVQHNLDKRDEELKKAEKLYDRMKEDSESLKAQAESVGASRANLETERKDFESYKSSVHEKEDLARLMLEQANAIAKDKGITLEPPKKEEKKEKGKK